jgi:hypothetical protein
MDILEQFIRSVSYKFPKGYPDIKDPKDVILLESLIAKVGIDIFSEDLNESETKGKATLFETALVKAWYNLNNQEIPSDAAEQKDLNALTPEMIEDAENILKKNNLTGGNGAKQLGSSSAPSTSFWKSHGAINITPKTDVVLGDKKISVKVGPSQLMSGAGNELTATFYAALKNSPNVEKQLIDNIADDIKKVFVKGTTKAGNVRQAKQKGDDETLSIAVDKMGVLKKNIKDFFSKNPEFLTNFAYEAATGEEKFGGNVGTADYVLSVASNYKNGKLHKIDKAYAKELANKMKLDISMKSGSQKLAGIKTGKYNYYTVLRAGLEDLFNDLSDDIKVDDNINF